LKSEKTPCIEKRLAIEKINPEAFNLFRLPVSGFSQSRESESDAETFARPRSLGKGFLHQISFPKVKTEERKT
jgi:hypothetical protein